MLKKILIGSGLVFILVIAYLMYFFLYATRQHSPLDTVSYNDNGFEISVTYSRPYKKGRIIFGAGDDALQTYGQYWRFGANRATKITINQPVTIMGNTLETGSYALYALPGEKSWVIGFNGQFDRWGATPPDYDHDIFRIEIVPEIVSQPVEQLTIVFEELSTNEVNMIGMWDTIKLTIPLRKKLML